MILEIYLYICPKYCNRIDDLLRFRSFSYVPMKYDAHLRTGHKFILIKIVMLPESTCSFQTMLHILLRYVEISNPGVCSIQSL